MAKSTRIIPPCGAALAGQIARGEVEEYRPPGAHKDDYYYRSCRKFKRTDAFTDGFNGPFPKVLTRFARGKTPEKAREFSDVCGPGVIAWDFT